MPGGSSGGSAASLAAGTLELGSLASASSFSKGDEGLISLGFLGTFFELRVSRRSTVRPLFGRSPWERAIVPRAAWLDAPEHFSCTPRKLTEPLSAEVGRGLQA